tara:strand:- start:469 stop:1122 length:654 start_codon:yes stop_codon:yes gene_type:complete
LTNILAIETSTDNCSVSIGKGPEIFNFHQNLPKQHTERLFEVINDLLNESGLAFSELNAVAVGVGPGSYTGVRLSCAIAQGIAFAQSIKCISLSSLELLSVEANQRFLVEDIVAISEENLGNIYIVESNFRDGKIDSKFKFISSEDFNFLDFPENYHFVGDGCSAFPEIKNILPDAFPKAENLLKIGQQRFNNNQLIEPEEILPIYLNDENSWKKLK